MIKILDKIVLNYNNFIGLSLFLNMIFQSGWKNDRHCTGAPSTMYVFQESNATDLYTFEADDIHIPACGYIGQPIQFGCCLSSVNVAETYEYTSFSFNYLDNTFTALNSPPVSANGNTYCSITSLTTGTLWGYNQAFYLSNKHCFDGNISCNFESIDIFN